MSQRAPLWSRLTDGWRAMARRLFPRRPLPTLSTRALPRGRASQDTQESYPGAAWLVQAPNDYASNWRLMNLSAKNFDQIEPARLLEMLADLSPEVSRALWDFLRMCNPGHTVKGLRAGSTEPDTRAQAALDAFLGRLSDLYGSTDVVIGRLFMGAFLRGALCSELVLDGRGRLAIDLVTPDPDSIRFRQRTDPERGAVWQAGQWQAGQFVPLDRATFRYVPIDPFFGSPYGRPMAAPALFTTLFLLGLLHDLKRVIQQQGYPRLDLSIDTARLIESAPQIMSNAEVFQNFTADIVRQVEAAYSALQPDDAYIHTDIVKVNGPVGTTDSSLQGIDALIKALERMAVRALKTMPLLLGITETTGDVQSNRQWEIHAAGIKSIQHYAETLLERLLGLALEAQGIQATVQFRFAELRAAEMLRDAQTEAMRIANAKAKRDEGWQSQDEASLEITGSPAVAPAPTAPASAPQIVQGSTDGMQLNTTPVVTRATRVKLIPDGADDPLLPVPETVTISDNDIERALDDWDRLLPDYAGLLDAVVIGGDQFDSEERGLRQRDPSPWTWEQGLKRYRNTATGQFINARQMVPLRDQFIEAKKGAGIDLAQRLGRGDITLQQWEIEFRQQVKTAFVDEYVLGKGGRNAMTQVDWGRVGAMAKAQYQFAHTFAQDIAAGQLSLAQIEARSALYFDSATQAFERGRAASHGLTLPEYPADGNQDCGSRCKCAWSIVEDDTEWRCTWVLDALAEHCATCSANAARWAPLVLAKGDRLLTPDQVRAHLTTVLNGHGG